MSHDPLVTFENNLMDLEQHFKREKHGSLSNSEYFAVFHQMKGNCTVQPDS